MRSVGIALAHHVVSLSVLMLAVLALAVEQHLTGPLTIPVMDQMAAETAAARATSSEPLAFPVAVAPAVSAQAPIAPARDQLLGEIHVSAGDAASRPADPTPSDPLRIAFALGVQSSVRVTVSADNGAVVATVLENPSAPAGSRVVDWNGTSAAGAPVPGGRYTLGVAASEDIDVYRLSTHTLHLYVARPGGGGVANSGVD
jgi:FlgD Ig-like domain